ncbi:MAG: Mrp/NBP35 family ATP-binding protein [Thaumarchaeota archaeon]|nr:Mrp/NBP35 family ATP-binding protein [Nitrososphaerota archaeon]
MKSREEIVDALRGVIDPEIHINIVDLNMVKDVKINKNDVEILIALTISGCPLAKTISSDIEKALAKIGISKVSVQTTAMTQEELEQVRKMLQQRMASGQKQGFQHGAVGIDRLDSKGIENIIAIVSGKGGVGKSFTTSLLAVELRKQGYEVGILDADITGPSQAKIFGLTERPVGTPQGVLPVQTKTGIKIISMQLLLDDAKKPTIWRGPIINNLIRQLYLDVNWGDLHYLLIDLPPGTSDAPLTVFQSLPLTGVVVVTTPQDLAKLIVTKSVNMAKALNVPILGIVENMAYVVCDHCGEKMEIFGAPKGELMAKEIDAPYMGAVPIDPKIAELSDNGMIEDYQSEVFPEITNNIVSNVQKFSEGAPKVLPISWKSKKLPIVK